MRFLDGCPFDAHANDLQFDEEDFPLCPHGFRAYGWASAPSKGTSVDSSQLREDRKVFRRAWSLRQQERVMQGRSRTDSVSP